MRSPVDFPSFSQILISTYLFDSVNLTTNDVPLVLARSGATSVFFAPGPSSLPTPKTRPRVPMAELVLAWLNNWIRKKSILMLKVDFKTTTPSNQGTSSCCKSFYHSWTLTRAACTSQGLSSDVLVSDRFQSSFLLQITTSASVCRNHNKIVTNLVPTQNKLNSVHNTKSL